VRSRGFTFAEVLFAVMLLGIGFIMVAAIFPVAIQQSQANLDETTGIGVAKAGARMMQAVNFSEAVLSYGGTGRWMANTPNQRVWPFDNDQAMLYPLYYALSSGFINQSDPRYAWVPLGYKLGSSIGPGWNGNPNGVAYYDVYVVAVACRIRPSYDPDIDVFNPVTRQPCYTFQPKTVFFALTEGGLNGNPDLITFCDPNSPTSVAPMDVAAAAEGTYVLVAYDQMAANVIVNNYRQGDAHGRMYRLGAKRDDLGPGVWELAPGDDMTYKLGLDGVPGTADDYIENLPPRGLDSWATQSKYSVPNGPPAMGFMIGRGYVDPSNPNGGVEGQAQDLYATRVTVFFK
jgi:hypothetical protein